MFKKLLVANRGEIALRVMRTCVEMGVHTVAVYSTADADQPSVQFADEAVCIGPAASAQSYLNMDNIISAALGTGCDAVHPGFGFLSENAEFARRCTENGLAFIGPAAATIEMMGDKARARALAAQAGAPVVPGSPAVIADYNAAREAADRVGYPVLVKASAGGGGRGMRRAYDDAELESAFATARAEAQACFGDDSVYIEKLIIDPRHVEFQILADKRGNVIHLGERDCSIQRNNQKLLEESPSPALTPELRQRMGAAAVAIARASHYEGAGTVEFIVSGPDFYFIEMNARIQVEHPVTEMRCGLDLIKEQLRIAAGLPVPIAQDQVRLDGCAIECRIVAEDPRNGFRPCPGRIDFLHLPGGAGVRVDTGLYNGITISPFYDSMIAKVIVWAPTRLEAIRRMRRALEETVVEGVDTNLELALLILFNGDFIRGKYSTGFIAAHLDTLMELGQLTDQLDSGKASA
jgi:acetyl-CoA carboxylase biotin carboxylase subunit